MTTKTKSISPDDLKRLEAVEGAEVEAKLYEVHAIMPTANRQRITVLHYGVLALNGKDAAEHVLDLEPKATVLHVHPGADYGATMTVWRRPETLNRAGFEKSLGSDVVTVQLK